MKFVLPTDLRDAERRILADPSTDPGTGLRWMREAAAGVAAEILALYPPPATPPVLVLAGPGNNGGDGFGVAALLARHGVPCEVWVAADGGKLSSDVYGLAEEALHNGATLRWRSGPDDWANAAAAFRAGGWRMVVDALLGTGARGEPRGAIAAALAFLRDIPGQTFRIALDVPSGWDGDSPVPPPWTPRADLTVTVGFPKKGFLPPSSREVVGALRVVPFSLPRDAADALPDAAPGIALVTPADLAPLFPPPPRATHKGDRGRLLVFAGSAPMPGAAVLATLGALRGGCGVVHASAFPAARAAIAARAPQAILAPPLFSPLDDFELDRFQAILAGPGLGRTPEAAAFVESLLARATGPLVLDADALNLLTPDLLRNSRADLVLTPHPAELARLLGCSVADVQADRLAAVRTAVSRTGATVVLKGDGTLIASPFPSLPVLLNLAGTPGMARGGSGDVLAGLLASLLASHRQKPRPAGESWLVASAAVYLHALAGELAAARLTSHAMNALDLPDFLPAAFSTLRA